MQDPDSVVIGLRLLGNLGFACFACGVAYSFVSAVIRRSRGVRAAWIVWAIATLGLASVVSFGVHANWPELASLQLVLYMTLAMFGIPLAASTLGIAWFSRREARGLAAMTGVGLACFVVGVIPGIVVASLPDLYSFMQSQSS